MINLDRCGTPVRGRPKSALPRDLARRAFEILASFHAVGFAHRDFHAGNLLVDAAGNVRIVDFEWAYDYGPSAPPLELTYDLTGRGLPSPSHTHHMHWDRRHRASLRAVTNVSAAEAYDQYVADLRKELTAVSGYKLGKRFDRGGLVYQTFHHPRFELKKGQRNVAARFLAMRVGNLKGKTVLDLGANLGSVSIQACLHGARQVTAVEADASRVQVARKIAAVTGLHRKIEFVTNDVNDYLRKAHGHDVVLCLALDAWVDDPQLLYRRAAATTKRILYLETNRLRRRSEVEPIFRNLGFRTVKYLGTTESEDAFGTRRLLFHIERRP
ncbi:MAG: methyltransferase domain-containing protein [Rhodothermales bacterium]|nr:methyltransferase domain-containing protein [Rhodothermales bacterium]